MGLSRRTVFLIRKETTKENRPEVLRDDGSAHTTSREQDIGLYRRDSRNLGIGISFLSNKVQRLGPYNWGR